MGSTGDRDWDAFKGGINDVMMNARDDCGTAVIEVDRRAELIKELEFQQSPYVDASTRVTRNLIIGDVGVRGSISAAAGDKAKVAMSIVDKRTGKTLGGRATTLDRGGWPDQLETLAKQLAGDLWTRDGNDGTTASIDCPPGGPGDPDPAPVPGMPGPALLNTAPEAFYVPYAGGAQAVSGIVADGGDGFFNMARSR